MHVNALFFSKWKTLAVYTGHNLISHLKEFSNSTKSEAGSGRLLHCSTDGLISNTYLMGHKELKF